MWTLDPHWLICTDIIQNLKWRRYDTHTENVCFLSDDSWVAFERKYYKFNTNYSDWIQARQTCRNLGSSGADLVVIDSRDEQVFINGRLMGIFAKLWKFMSLHMISFIKSWNEWQYSFKNTLCSRICAKSYQKYQRVDWNQLMEKQTHICSIEFHWTGIFSINLPLEFDFTVCDLVRMTFLSAVNI